MKHTKHTLIALVALAPVLPSALAQNGTWTNLNDSVWSAGTNWLEAAPANGSGNTANFSTTDQPSTRIVVLDSSRTIGNLSFGDTDTNTPASWVITTNTPGGGQVLTLAGTTPTITVGALAPGNFAELQVTNAGTAGFTKDGSGELRLTGINTISGPINVNAGRLYLASGIFGGGTLPSATTTNFLRNGSTLSAGNSVTNVFVPAGHTGNFEARATATASGLGGGAASVLNIVLQAGGGTVTAGGSWAKGGSLSNINVTSTGDPIGFLRLRPNGSAFDTINSLTNTVLNLDRITMFAVDNSGGNTFNFGAVNGTTNAVWRGAQNGAANYIVGSLNQNMLFEGSMVDDVVGASGFNLTKVGTGTLTLSGTNITYGGDNEATVSRRGGFTTINAGTLALANGASLGRGTVSGGVEYFAEVVVNSGATYDLTGTTNNTTSPLTILRGTGVVKGNYVHDEAVLSPAGALVAGTLTFLNDLTITNFPSIDPNTSLPYALITSNSVVRFDISPSLTSGNDLINVGGKAYVDGNPDLEVNFLGGASGGSYVLINATNGVVGSPLAWNVKWGGRGAAPTVTATANQILLNVSLGGSASLVWQGFTNGVWDVNTTSNWLNGVSVDKFFQLDSVTFNESSPLTPTITLGAIVTPASMTVSNNATTYSITGSGQIGGGTSLLKRGPGTLTLTTGNTYAGGTTNSDGGTLDIGGTTSALGIGPLTMNGATFRTLLGSSAATFPTPISFAANTTNILQADGAGNTILGGNLTGPGSTRVLLQSDTASKGLDFSGTNSGFTGTFQFGTSVFLRFRNDTSGGTSATRWEMNNSGGLLSSLGNNAPRTFELGYLSGGINDRLSGHESSGGGAGSHVTWVIGGLNLNMTFDGVIRNGNQASGSNVTAIVKVGSGTLTLSGTNTYSGGTTISNGTVEAASTVSLSYLSPVNILTPGLLRLSYVGTNFVRTLAINGVTQPNGTYGATGSGAGTIDNTHFAGTGVLSVGPPPPATLSSTTSGTQVTLDWPASQGWRLQAQTNNLNTGITTNWFDAPATTPPYTVNIDLANPTVFYRLINP